MLGLFIGVVVVGGSVWLSIATLIDVHRQNLQYRDERAAARTGGLRDDRRDGRNGRDARTMAAKRHPSCSQLRWTALDDRQLARYLSDIGSS